MLIEEGMTAGDHQTREMYARYGLAMYFAQVVEASIKSALVMAELSSSKFATLDDFDDSWAENFTVTMGRLVRKLTPFLSDDTALGDDLQLALLCGTSSHTTSSGITLSTRPRRKAEAA